MKESPLLLRNRDFRILWMSQVLSQAGNRMFQIAVAWWILKQGFSNSGFYLALFMVLGALPSIALAKWIGRVIDSKSARSILLINDSLGGITALALAIAIALGYSSMIAILICGVLFAIYSAFIDPTIGKSVTDLVDDADIEPAVALNSSTSLMASFCGAIVGGMLIDHVGIMGVTLLNGLSYILAAVCDVLINFKRKSSILQATPAPGVDGDDIFTGIPVVKKLLYGFAAVNFFGTPVLIVLPIYAKTALNGTGQTLSFLESAIWLGLLSGTFLAERVGYKERTIFFTALCLTSFSICLAIPSIELDSYKYAISLFGVGASLGLLNVRLISLFQKIIPDGKKGRFFALLQAMTSFTVPIGFFVFGWLTDFWSIYLVSFVQGFGIFLIAILFYSLSSKESQILKYIPAERN
jgi:MFS family permease